jgi:hypothetical protein
MADSAVLPEDQLISVVPVEGGWSVQCALTGQSLLFLSGARAEENARRLAACVARLGYDARVAVHDRRNALVATLRFFAEG